MTLAFQWNRSAHADSLARRAVQIEMSTQRLHSLAQAHQPQPLPALARVEAAPVVFEAEANFAAGVTAADPLQ
jgi:hypothetical protein